MKEPRVINVGGNHEALVFISWWLLEYPLLLALTGLYFVPFQINTGPSKIWSTFITSLLRYYNSRKNRVKKGIGCNTTTRGIIEPRQPHINKLTTLQL